ncbi:hypothetical protein ILYODFUR_022372 [Ilyodon furcidens]|uniref:Uncharacterized protein n=1 Tax=Ilyodon furcidens TaxID=33524 RepID=A0ABV0TX72_9TELE
MHFFVVDASFGGSFLWEKIGLIWSCLRSAAMSGWAQTSYLCVRDRKRRYKNQELITSLRQLQDKQARSLCLCTQSGFWMWHKLQSLEWEHTSSCSQQGCPTNLYSFPNIEAIDGR